MKLFKPNLETIVPTAHPAPIVPEAAPPAEPAPVDDAETKAAEETRFQNLLKRASSPGPEIGYGWGTSVKMKGGGYGFGQ